MNKCAICTPVTGIKVSLDTYVQRCKYHGSLRKNSYNFRNIAAKRLCPDLFYAAYPYCLALLYDAKINGRTSVAIGCPNPDGKIKIKIEIKPLPFKTLLNKIERWARRYGKPLSLTDKRVIMRVTEVGGRCPWGHKVAERFEFNIGFFPDLCPASFHSIYPFIFLSARNMLSRFSDSDGLVGVGCPDAKNAITYKIYEE